MMQISKVDGLIGIRTTNAQLTMRQPRPDFQMHTELPKVEIHTEFGQVRINQKQCFSEEGLKDVFELTSDFAADGAQAALEFIAKKNSEGDMKAAIDKGYNAIPQIAVNNSYTQHVYDIKTMPMSRPQIDFVGGNVDIRVHEGSVEIQAKSNMPQIEYQPGKVDIYMQKYPEINFKYIGNNIDYKA